MTKTVMNGTVAGAFAVVLLIISFRLVSTPLRAADPAPSHDPDQTIMGLVNRVKELEKKLSATQDELKTTRADLGVATHTTTLNKTKLEEVTKLLENDVIKFDSAVRFQVRDEPKIIGTHGKSFEDGTVVDVGTRDGNDNWFRMIRRP